MTVDAIANIKCVRRKPELAPAPGERTGPKLVEIAHAKYQGLKDHGACADNPAAKKGADMHLQHFGLRHAPPGK